MLQQWSNDLNVETDGEITVGDQTEVVVFLCPMRNDDEPDCRPARRWVRPGRLVLFDERVTVVFIDELLNFPGLWRTCHELDAKFFERHREVNAVEATVDVKTVYLDVFAGLGDELAEHFRQLVSIVPFESHRSKCKPDAWIDNTDGSKLVRTIGTLRWIRCTDVGCLFVSVIVSVVNIDRDVY